MRLVFLFNTEPFCAWIRVPDNSKQFRLMYVFVLFQKEKRRRWGGCQCGLKKETQKGERKAVQTGEAVEGLLLNPVQSLILHSVKKFKNLEMFEVCLLFPNLNMVHILNIFTISWMALSGGHRVTGKQVFLNLYPIKKLLTRLASQVTWSWCRATCGVVL